MNLDLFNNLLSSVKENNVVENFIKELAGHLERVNNKMSNENEINNLILKQENCLYQVVEIDVDGVYLKNTENNRVAKETDIAKDILDKIGNDSILKFEYGRYVYEEELTEKFFDSLVGIKEYEEIKDRFIEESNILEIDENMRYKLEFFDGKYGILSYDSAGKKSINVPKELVPFWAKEGDTLYYKDGKFSRDI